MSEKNSRKKNSKDNNIRIRQKLFSRFAEVLIPSENLQSGLENPTWFPTKIFITNFHLIKIEPLLSHGTRRRCLR